MDGDSGAPEGVDLGRHLTEDELNARADARLTHDERQVADAHLALCSDCHQKYVGLRMIRSVMSDLPSKPVPRSFQLGPEHATRPAARWTLFANSLLPMLPALRATTLVLVL